MIVRSLIRVGTAGTACICHPDVWKLGIYVIQFHTLYSYDTFLISGLNELPLVQMKNMHPSHLDILCIALQTECFVASKFQIVTPISLSAKKENTQHEVATLLP